MALQLFKILTSDIETQMLYAENKRAKEKNEAEGCFDVFMFCGICFFAIWRVISGNDLFIFKKQFFLMSGYM